MAEYIDRGSIMRTAHILRPEDKELMSAISSIPSVSVPQWISVKDRLPKAEQEVLVISRGWGDRLLYVGQYQKMEAQTSPLTGITSKESDWMLWGWSYLKEPQVTHWMPLPELPEGDSAE